MGICSKIEVNVDPASTQASLRYAMSVKADK